MWEPRLMAFVVIPVVGIALNYVVWLKLEARNHPTHLPARAIAWSRAVSRVAFCVLTFPNVFWVVVGLFLNVSALVAH